MFIDFYVELTFSSTRLKGSKKV